MIKTLALVLKKQDLGETDRILTIFSPDLGKKRIIAKAVRRPLSKLAGHLDTLMLSELILTDEENLPKVTSANSAETFTSIRRSLAATQKAFAITKIIDRILLEDVAQRPLFRLTVESLSKLNNQQSWQLIWLAFLSGVSTQLGLGVTDLTCRFCKKGLRGSAYWLIDERHFSCQDCPRLMDRQVLLSLNSLKLLKLLTKHSFNQLIPIKIPQSVGLEVEELLLQQITDWFNKPWQSYASLDRS